jgi:hypothetical protein
MAWNNVVKFAGAKKQIIGLHQQDQRVDSWPGPAQRSF